MRYKVISTEVVKRIYFVEAEDKQQAEERAAEIYTSDIGNETGYNGFKLEITPEAE